MQKPNYIAYPNQVTRPFRPVAPANFQEGSPPFVNQSFDRFNGIRQTIQPYRYISRPLQHYQSNLGHPAPRKLPPRLQYQLKLIPPRPPIEIAYRKFNEPNIRMPAPASQNPINEDNVKQNEQHRKSFVYDLDSDDSSSHGSQRIVTENINRGTKSRIDQDGYDMTNNKDVHETKQQKTFQSRKKEKSLWNIEQDSSDDDHSHTCGNHIPQRLHNS
ncbi:hypothetical protein I4U23_019431 [Adineta vaga]|nr:hypothetical protein I4U23_019431 [Adineta vaga]